MCRVRTSAGVTLVQVTQNKDNCKEPWCLTGSALIEAPQGRATRASPTLHPHLPMLSVGTPSVVASGIPQQGVTISATATTTGNNVVPTYEYAWTDGLRILGRGQSFTPTDVHQGLPLYAVAVASSEFSEAALASRFLGVVFPIGGPLNSKAIIIKGGKLKVGATLVSPTPKVGWTVSAYQWLRNGKPIKGATARTYKVKPIDAGMKISVRTTLQASSGPSQTVTTSYYKIPRPSPPSPGRNQPPEPSR